MTMNTEQLRADFEVWAKADGYEDFERFGEGYSHPELREAWRGYQAGRAALQSQDAEDADRIDFLEAEGGGDFLQLKSGEWIVDTSSRFGMAGDLRSAIDLARRVEEIK